jgi:hypothetical protein
MQQLQTEGAKMNMLWVRIWPPLVDRVAVSSKAFMEALFTSVYPGVIIVDVTNTAWTVRKYGQEEYIVTFDSIKSAAMFVSTSINVIRARGAHRMRLWLR